MQRLITELKRRNVFRATAAYSVVAWVVGQLAELILPTFEAPAWMLKAVIALLILGLPLVLVLAWVYELTPEGVRRTDEEHYPPPGQANGTRAIDSIIILALITAVLVLTVAPDAWRPVISMPYQAQAQQILQEGPRVVVLPMATVSSSPESSLLARGFSRLLRQELQFAPVIQVFGRESSLRIREASISPAAMARDFQVDYVVQTSLRSNGSRVVMELQVIDARDDREIWAGTFDTNDTDVRGVAAEMLAVLREQFGIIKTTFTGSELDGTAFDLWLKVLATAGTKEAERLAEQKSAAIRISELAPDFGPAKVVLAQASLDAAELTGSPVFSEAAIEARSMLEAAIGASPTVQRVQLFRARLESRLDVWRARTADFERLSEIFESLLDQFPFDPALQAAYARHLYRWGAYPKAAERARAALRQDPFSSDLYETVIASLVASGRLDEAGTALQALPQEIPEATRIRLMGQVAVAKGELDQAVVFLQQAPKDLATLTELVRIELSRDNKDKALSWLEAWPADGSEVWQIAIEEGPDVALEHAKQIIVSPDPQQAALLGRLAMQAGEFEEAVTWFEIYFPRWVDDLSQLQGPVAWLNAPWYAAALLAVGKEEAGQRILDRHLAGIISAEPALSDSQRNLYLAANFAVRKRNDDAISALERVATRGFGLSWGAFGTPSALRDVVLLANLSGDARFFELVKRIAPAPVQG